MSFIIEKKLEIDAPAVLVWEVITDVARYGGWNPFLVECKTTFKPGAPIDMQVKLGAKPQAQREWVLEFVPGKRFAYRMKPVPLGALSSFRSHDVEAIGDVRTRYRSYFELRGWLRHLVLALFQSKLETGFEGMSLGIKRRAEQLCAQRQSEARR